MADQRTIQNPFLRGQYAAQFSNQSADESELTGIAKLLQLQQSASDHPLKQDLLRAQVADAQAKPEDRRLQMENVRATNMARISQQADQFERNMQMKLRTITNAEEKSAWDREYQQGRLALEGAARQQGAERLFYDTGIRSPVPQVGMAPGATPGGSPGAPVPPVAPTAAPSGPPAAPGTGGGLERLIDPKSVQASVNSLFPLSAQASAAAEGADIQRRELMPNGGGMLPVQNVLGYTPGQHGAPAPMPGRLRDKLAFEQAKGADLSSPESQQSVAFWSEVVQKGGSLPPGLARTPEGAALVKEVMKRVGGGGVKPIDIMANQAEFMGEKAGQRTLGTRTANIEMASTEAAGLARLALVASEEWNRTGLKTLNDVERYAQSRTASPELRRFVAANTSFINAYARAINPQGVGTVADKEHAREMLEVGFSKGDYAAAINQLQAEIKTAQESPGQVKSSMRERFTGEAPAPAAPKEGRRPLSAFEGR